jgi:hypothetical protein
MGLPDDRIRKDWVRQFGRGWSTTEAQCYDFERSWIITFNLHPTVGWVFSSVFALFVYHEPKRIKIPVCTCDETCTMCIEMK